jgi:hypothetical protein
VVQKTALRGLKAAQHGHVENLFLRECPAALDEVVEEIWWLEAAPGNTQPRPPMIPGTFSVLVFAK